MQGGRFREPRANEGLEAWNGAQWLDGLVPKVVPEFRKITVGGALMGGAMESSSFAHGTFGDTISACELLLSNGTRGRG